MHVDGSIDRSPQFRRQFIGPTTPSLRICGAQWVICLRLNGPS
jgi:hypothetical protein